MTTLGWLGKPCEKCDGEGRVGGEEGWERACVHCGGTGEAYGELETSKALPMCVVTAKSA